MKFPDICTDAINWYNLFRTKAGFFNSCKQKVRDEFKPKFASTKNFLKLHRHLWISLIRVTQSEILNRCGLIPDVATPTLTHLLLRRNDEVRLYLVLLQLLVALTPSALLHLELAAQLVQRRGRDVNSAIEEKKVISSIIVLL